MKKFDWDLLRVFTKHWDFDCCGNRSLGYALVFVFAGALIMIAFNIFN